MAVGRLVLLAGEYVVLDVDTTNMFGSKPLFTHPNVHPVTVLRAEMTVDACWTTGEVYGFL